MVVFVVQRAIMLSAPISYHSSSEGQEMRVRKNSINNIKLLILSLFIIRIAIAKESKMQYFAYLNI